MIFVLAFLVLALLMAGMSIGVIMKRKPLTGSCGGVGAALGEDDYVCDLCGGDEKKCEEQKVLSAQASMTDATSPYTAPSRDLAYDASQRKNTD